MNAIASLDFSAVHCECVRAPDDSVATELTRHGGRVHGECARINDAHEAVMVEGSVALGASEVPAQSTARACVGWSGCDTAAVVCGRLCNDECSARMRHRTKRMSSS